MKSIPVAFAAAMFLLISSLQGDLHAYLDPGTGSVAVQLILGGLVAALAAVRLYWGRVKGFFRRTREPEPTPDRR
jgi:hypothetical protein